MPSVGLTINGRTYSVSCGAGEEERLRRLETLPPTQYRVAEAIIFGASCQDVAAELGVHPSRITQHLKAIHAWLAAADEVTRPEPVQVTTIAPTAPEVPQHIRGVVMATLH